MRTDATYRRSLPQLPSSSLRLALWPLLGLCVGSFASCDQAQTAAGVEARDSPRLSSALPLTSSVAVEQQKLVASDKALRDSFGQAVAIFGNTAIVGAPDASAAGTDKTGAAYVFVRAAAGSPWTEQQKLTASDKATDDGFGTAVAISGDTVAIGAPYASLGGAGKAGATYVFVRAAGATTWTEQQKLSASDKAADDGFGTAVAISGDTVAIGSPYADPGAIGNAGAAYVFVRSTGATPWAEQQKLSASDKAPYDSFGVAVAISGNTVVIGSPYAAPGGGDSTGAAYVFVRPTGGTTWAIQQELTASDRATDNYFGAAVALFGDTIAVGSPGARTTLPAPGYGEAYVYTRLTGGTTWTEQRLISSDKATAVGEFGISIAISADDVVIGTANADVIPPALYAGAAYVFERSADGSSWSERPKLVPSVRAGGDEVGFAVAISGDTALVGDPHPDASSFGATYIYTDLSPKKANGNLCGSAAGCVSGFCVDGFCCDSACGGGSALDCQACSAALKQTGADGVCGIARARTICRPAAGTCDIAEACDGVSLVCPADTVLKKNTSCRSAAGACDVAEVCNGSSPSCPADGKKPAGQVCRAAAGVCDRAESCDGASAACPADVQAPAGTVCRAATGLCDAAETCTGTSALCPANALIPAGTICRAAAGDCDNAERCTGASASCPTDGFKSSATVCRSAAGACDIAEKCSGTSARCPTDAFQSNITVCRSSAGPCDQVEFCPGTGVACPLDQFKPPVVQCRPAIGACDLTDYCVGTSPACPPDELQPAGTTCRPAMNSCDQTEACSGTNPVCPPDQFQPDGTACTGGMCKAGMCI